MTIYMDKHYVCTGGCHSMASMPGICETSDCGKSGHPLMECKCTDGKHAGIVTPCEKCGKLCKLTGGCEMEKFKPEIAA